MEQIFKKIYYLTHLHIFLDKLIESLNEVANVLAYSNRFLLKESVSLEIKEQYMEKLVNHFINEAKDNLRLFNIVISRNLHYNGTIDDKFELIYKNLNGINQAALVLKNTKNEKIIKAERLLKDEYINLKDELIKYSKKYPQYPIPYNELIIKEIDRFINIVK